MTGSIEREPSLSGTKAVVIERRDEEYARLVVEVDDPRATADTVAAALRG